MKNKFKIDKRILSRNVTDEDRELAKRKSSILKSLGIETYYDTIHDSKHTNKVIVPSMYNTIDEYEADKFEVRLLLAANKEIPKELFNKLLAAHKELENK